MGNKRIIQLNERTQLNLDDYLAVDNLTGTRKLSMQTLLEKVSARILYTYDIPAYTYRRNALNSIRNALLTMDNIGLANCKIVRTNSQNLIEVYRLAGRDSSGFTFTRLYEANSSIAMDKLYIPVSSTTSSSELLYISGVGVVIEDNSTAYDWGESTLQIIG